MTDTDTNRYLAKAFNLLIIMAHIFSVMLCVYMIYLAQPGSSLFSWHPTLMTIGFGLFMFEAILLFSPYSSLLNLSERKIKAKYHWILQLASAVCIHLGFAAIFYNKVSANKPHFTTWHGKAGLSAIVMTTLQAVAGSSLIYYNSRLLNPSGMSLGMRKKIHALFGALTFFLGYIALVLSLYSTFLLKLTSQTSWYALLMFKTMLVSIVINQVSSAHLFKKD